MLLKKTFSIAISFILALTVFSVVPFNNYVKGADDVTLSPSNPTNNSAAFSGLGDSLVVGDPTINYRKSTNKGATWTDVELLTEQNNKENPANKSNLYDMDFSTKDFLGGFKRWSDADTNGIIKTFYGGSTSSPRYRCDIVYDLKAKSQIKDILLIHASRDFKNPILRNGHYEIFLSNDKDKIFDKENSAYEFKNDANSTVPFSQKITFNTKREARFVALSIYNPYATTDLSKIKANDLAKMKGNCYVRLFEFNVFGAAGDYSLKRQHVPHSISSYTPTLQNNKNLIKGKEPASSFVYRDTDITDDKEGSKYPITYYSSSCEAKSTHLTDDSSDISLEVKSYPADEGNFSRKATDTGKKDASGRTIYLNDVIDNEKELYYQYNYKLDSTVNVTGASLVGHHESLLTPSHFKVSVANNPNDLFTNKAVYTTPDLYTGCDINELTFKTAKKGTYVGFRIICGVNFDSTTETVYQAHQLYLRPAELCVYGTYTDTTKGVTHTSKIAPLENKSVNTAITVNYKANPDNNKKYPKGTKADIKAAASVRYDRKLYRFLYWTDEEGNKIGENQWLINRTLPTSVTAIYGTKSPNDTVKITFEDKQGTVLHTATVGFGDYVSRADYEKANSLVPEIAGYKKAYELTEVGSRTANVQLWNVDIYNTPADSNIRVTPIYKVADTTYSVKVDSAASQKLPFDTKVYLSANKNWLVNGVNWHAGSSYTYVTGDMTITSNSDKKYGIALYNPSGKKSPTLQGGNFTAFAKLNLESGAKIQQCGVIYLGYNGGKAPTTTDFVLGKQAQKIVAKTPTGNHFACTLKGVGKKRTRYARAYVILESQEILYSNIIKVTT